MYGFSILMSIFGVLVILAGYYVYRGHNSELLLWRGYNPNRTKTELKVIGKWTMIVGLIIIIIAIIGYFLEKSL